MKQTFRPIKAKRRRDPALRPTVAATVLKRDWGCISRPRAQISIPRSAAFDLDGANAVEARYDIGLYPCYVISLTDLCELDVVQPHEELLKVGKLRVLTPRTRRPSCAFTYFVSHNWDQPDFPDNKRNTKLRWLKGLRMHLNLDDESEVWLWWDYISIPQRNRKNQIKAISSIVHYVHLCSRFLPLVRDEAEYTQKRMTPKLLKVTMPSSWHPPEIFKEGLVPGGAAHAMCPRYRPEGCEFRLVAPRSTESQVQVSPQPGRLGHRPSNRQRHALGPKQG